MELPVIIALTIAASATMLGIFTKTTGQIIRLLSIQAAAVGFVELIFCLINLLLGLGLEALVDFFAAFAEWFASAAVSPLIIYWCMVKTENVSDKPVITNLRGSVFFVTIVILNVILCVFVSYYLPAKIDTLPFVALMFSLSLFIIATRADPIKILVGLNMAENSFYPLFAESPLFLIPFMLALMIFVNLAGAFIIIEAYMDYGTLSIDNWRLRR